MFLMQNNVELLTSLDSFEGDNGISWKLMNIKMKWIKSRKYREVQLGKLKLVTVGYIKRDDSVVDPDSRPWRCSVVHTWMSHNRSSNPLSVRHMLSNTYPHAKYVCNLIRVSHVNPNLVKKQQ